MLRSIIDKLEKSNQVFSESIALIESKIIEVNQRIDDTVTSNTPQKAKKKEATAQDNPRIIEI